MLDRQLVALSKELDIQAHIFQPAYHSSRYPAGIHIYNAVAVSNASIDSSGRLVPMAKRIQRPEGCAYAAKAGPAMKAPELDHKQVRWYCTNSHPTIGAATR